jgi:hypothetical protein
MISIFATMKRHQVTSVMAGIVLVFCAIILGACGASFGSFDKPDIVLSPAETAASTSITLSLGKTVRIEAEECTIRFSKVLEDSVTVKSQSRNGKVLLEVKFAGSIKKIVLNTVKGPKMYDFEGKPNTLWLSGFWIRDGNYEIVLHYTPGGFL